MTQGNIAHKKDSHQAVFFNVLTYHKLNCNCVYLRCMVFIGVAPYDDSIDNATGRREEMSTLFRIGKENFTTM